MGKDDQAKPVCADILAAQPLSKALSTPNPMAGGGHLCLIQGPPHCALALRGLVPELTVVSRHSRLSEEAALVHRRIQFFSIL